MSSRKRDNSPRAFWIERLGLSAMLCCAMGAGYAAEVSGKISIEGREEYNDNVLLVPKPEKSVFVTTISPSAGVKVRTERTDLTADVRANINRYSGSSDLNSNDLLLDSALQHRFERDTLGLIGGYHRDSTLASELNQTGVVQARRQRRKVFLSPSWTALPTERLSLKVGYDYAKVKYDDLAGTGLVNYRVSTPYASARMRFTEIDEGFVTAGVTRYRPDQSPNRFRVAYVDLGYIRDFSEAWRGELSVGANRVKFSRAGDESERSGSQAQASVTRKFGVSDLRLSLGRELNPTGSGELTQTDKAVLGWNGKLSPRWGYSFNAAIYRNAFFTSNTASRRERYYRLGGAFDWQVSEDWVVEFGANRGELDPEQGDGATANAVFVNARYTWPHVFTPN